MPMNGLCEFLAGAWFQLVERVRPPASVPPSMDKVLESLATREIALQLQSQKAVLEARRMHAQGQKALFRSRMLEHRRVQAQLLQLQRYKENVQTQMDALSNHEINRALVDAMQSAVKAHGKNTAVMRDDADEAMRSLNDTMAHTHEITELLGQPLEVSEEVDDDELLELMGEAHAVPVAPEKQAELERKPLLPAPPVRQLVIPPMRHPMAAA